MQALCVKLLYPQMETTKRILVTRRFCVHTIHLFPHNPKLFHQKIDQNHWPIMFPKIRHLQACQATHCQRHSISNARVAGHLPSQPGDIPRTLGKPSQVSYWPPKKGCCPKLYHEMVLQCTILFHARQFSRLYQHATIPMLSMLYILLL